MSADAMVFHDDATPIADLVRRAQERPVHLALKEVEVEEPGRAQEGESWRPALAPFEPWAHDAAFDGADGPGGADGDLLVVGSLGMGISDEARQALIAGAVGGKGPQVPACAAALAPTAPVAVRRDGHGWVLSAMRLRDLVPAGGPAEGLVVVVPSSVGGEPVVRIAAEALCRRFVSGVRVRLLVVPDSVELVAARAFSAACVETVHLGASVGSFDPAPLDLALSQPPMEARRYIVSEANERLASVDGCLVEGRSRLLFADAPYGSRLVIPEGVQVVGSAAFAKGALPPRVVDAPTSLRRVDASPGSEVLWRGEDPVALARVVARCGGRAMGLDAVEEEGCWYGFSEGAAPGAPGGAEGAFGAGGPDGCPGSVPAGRQALLVAGPPAPESASRRFSVAARARSRGEEAASPRAVAADAADALAAEPSAAERLALPRSVGGAPLAAIADRALETAPAVLSIPGTVRVIGDGNACKGTRRLLLGEGVRSIGRGCFCSRRLAPPVALPASVACVGHGSFEYAVVRLAALDAVVHVSSDPALGCFMDEPVGGAPFDFARYDGQLLQGRGLPDRLGALLHRLAAPVPLDPAVAASIVGALRDQADEAIARVARDGDAALVRAVAGSGFLDDASLFERQLERLRACNRVDAVLFLMDWRHGREPEGSRAGRSARERFSLG